VKKWEIYFNFGVWIKSHGGGVGIDSLSSRSVEQRFAPANPSP